MYVDLSKSVYMYTYLTTETASYSSAVPRPFCVCVPGAVYKGFGALVFCVGRASSTAVGMYLYQLRPLTHPFLPKPSRA